MIIYAKDSLLKIVNFSSNSGKQELIKHLRLNRSFILLETPEQNYAVRTNEHLSIDSSENYTFKRKKGMRKIAGIPVKKLSLKHNKISKALTFYYTESISAKYANVYKNLPGLPLLFYLPTEDGLFKYTLKELKKNSPPLDLFIIPKGYKIETLPESISIGINQKQATFDFYISSNAEQITINSNLDLNSTNIPAEEYDNLKNLFKI